MKRFKTFSIKVEEGLFGRLEDVVKYCGVARNRWMTDQILTGVECDEDTIKSDKERGLGNTLKEEVTPKLDKQVGKQVTPKTGEVVEGADSIGESLVTPKVTPNNQGIENANDFYEIEEAMWIVGEYYRKNPDSKKKKKEMEEQIEKEAEALVDNPKLISCYK
jgi:hypothetical protein